MGLAAVTLIVAADVQDYVILAGDHCAVLSKVSNQGPPDAVFNNYRKVYPWKYGAIVASGDVFLMAYFTRLFATYDAAKSSIHLTEIARQAKAARSAAGVPADTSTGNLFFTLPGSEGFQLHDLSIREDTIALEVIPPISAHFSMRETSKLDQAAYHTFCQRLRPSLFFPSIEDFQRHHIKLVGELFALQSATDDLVTPSFDLFMLDKRTGEGLYWPVQATRPDTTIMQLVP